MTANNAGTFTLYRQGYDDGYYGREITHPDDVFYMNGYSKGCEDDQLGAVNKYSDNS